ncbi:MAG: hypothetical protein ACOYN3_00640 [Acidimicrobiia bacterium]
MRRWIVGIAAVCAVGLGACGSSNDSKSASELPSKEATVDTGAGSGGSGSTSTTRSSTTSKVEVATDGTLYSPAGDEFAMRVPASWTMVPNAAATVAWLLTPRKATGFTSNVNVITQKPISATSDTAVVNAMRQDATKSFSDTKILNAGTVKLPGGGKIYEIEYTATISGTSVHLYQVMSTGVDSTAFATLTTAPGEFATFYPKVRPYMLTLEAN